MYPMLKSRMQIKILTNTVELKLPTRAFLAKIRALDRGGGNPMENPKVKTKVRDPPNLIPGIDIRCFA